MTPFLLHLLILYILIFGVLHLFPLRGDLKILSYLWMIFLDILGFIWFTIGLNLFLFTKVFRLDNAQEYNDKSFLSFLDNHGTLPQWSCPYTSQQNGRAEWKHRHILDVVWTLLISASLPKRFWGKAALTAMYTINRIPSPTTHNKSPFELLYGHTPDYSSLWVFGCACFVSLPPHKRTKL